MLLSIRCSASASQRVSGAVLVASTMMTSCLVFHQLLQSASGIAVAFVAISTKLGMTGMFLTSWLIPLLFRIT